MYSSHEELDAALKRVLVGSRKICMEYSPRGAVPYVSKIDAGTLERVREFGVEVVLERRFCLQAFLTWSALDLELHRKAVTGCVAAKDAGFRFIHDRLRAGESVTELEVQAVVERVIAEHGLTNDHPAIVGFAGHAGDPHYAPNPEGNRRLEFDTCVLIDLWGGVPGHPMADITWMGYAGEPSAEFLRVWETVSAARDAAIAVLRPGLPGWVADKAGRDLIDRRRVRGRFHAPDRAQPRDGGHARERREPGQLGDARHPHPGSDDRRDRGTRRLLAASRGALRGERADPSRWD